MNTADKSETKIDTSSGTEEINDDNLIDMIVSGKWEDVLLNLTGDMDPWNIDLVLLAERFMDFIKKTNKEDLNIPAKIILTAAILYRMKVDTFRIYKEEKDDALSEERIENIYEDIENADMSDVKIPPISVPLLRRPSGKVSLDELINALDRAMTVKNRREAREIFQVDLCGEDISDSIEMLFAKICEGIDVDNILKFSAFIRDSDRKDILRTFNSLLHLSNQERIHLEQPEMFGEIYLTVSQQ
ncbi:MAG: hypothetical protein U9P44_02710 [archaeon]|nr:hypothetical protein [archaeon]